MLVLFGIHRLLGVLLMKSKLLIFAIFIAFIFTLTSCSSPEEAAAKKAKKAAQDGAAIGQLKIGRAYHTGEGVPQDNLYAYMWVSLAVNQGLGATAEESLRMISADMTASEIEEAKKLAIICKKEKGYRDC
jgi:TPR repeat protein